MWGKAGASIMALIGLGCLCASLYFLVVEVLLDVTGHSTNGTVTEKSTSTDEDDHISYYISYSYQDDNNQTYTSRSDVYKEMFDDAVDGAPIPVVYLSPFPSISRIRAAGDALWLVGILALIGVPTLWYGLWMLLRRIHWDNKTARLMKNGERRIGRLVAAEEDKGEEVEDYIPLVLVYAFTDKTGQEHTGKTFHVKPGDHDFWKERIGCPLEIRVNPADPTDHIALVEESKLLEKTS
jgi:hypothetical protein